MIAIELGRNRHAVRDVRRTVRQGLWAAVDDRRADLARSCGTAEPILLAIGQEPALAAAAAAYMRTLQWGAAAVPLSTSCCAASSPPSSGRAGRSWSVLFAVAVQCRSPTGA